MKPAVKNPAPVRDETQTVIELTLSENRVFSGKKFEQGSVIVSVTGPVWLITALDKSLAAGIVKCRENEDAIKLRAEKASKK